MVNYMEQKLKILPKYYKAVKEGRKTFEIRKDDREFKVGDTLILEEYYNDEKYYTGNSVKVKITYILGRNEDEKSFIPDGYIAFGIKLIS